MKTRKITLLSTLLLFLCAGAMAVESTLTELKLTPVENLVPSHYSGVYDKMQYLLNDPFDYQIEQLNAPTETTPKPIVSQIKDTTIFVPASLDETHRFMDGVAYTDELWDNEFANSAVFDISIPDGQILKYFDLWCRDYDGGRNQDLVIILYNGDLSVKSKSFNVPSTGYSYFTRIDFAEQGFTDNLLTDADRIVIRHGAKKTFATFAECRAVTETNPYTETVAPTLLAETHVGDLFVNSDMTVGISGNYGATMYLVPSGKASSIADIQSSNVYKFIAEPDSLYSISSVGLDLGNYKWVALDFAGNLSSPSAEISIIEDHVKPVITCASSEFVQTEWMTVTCDESATAYMVPAATAADTGAIYGAAEYERGLSVGDNILSTYSVSGGEYVLYSVDKSFNISEPLAFTIVAMGAAIYENIEILGADGGTPHYIEGGVKHVEPSYIYADGFDYNPNNAAAGPQPVQDNAVDTAAFFPMNNDDDAWLAFYFDMNEKQKMCYMDVWGRGGDDQNGGYRHHNLLITLTDTLTGESWTSHSWSGVSLSTATPSSYGRFYFSTADVQPQSLLSTANSIMVRHKEGYNDFVSIYEVRVGSEEWVNSAPEASAGPAQTVVPGATVTLDASGSYDVDSAFQTLTYAWTSATGITLSDETAMQPTFTAPDVTESKTYSFRLIVSDSEGEKSQRATVTITVDPAADIDELSIEGFNVYPNPSSDIFNLDLTRTSSSSMVKVTDLTGKELYCQSAMAGSVHTIDVSSLAKGLCILSIENDGKQLVRKLVVD